MAEVVEKMKSLEIPPDGPLASASPKASMLLSLPPELKQKIFENMSTLGQRDKVMSICSDFKVQMLDPALWRDVTLVFSEKASGELIHKTVQAYAPALTSIFIPDKPELARTLKELKSNEILSRVTICMNSVPLPGVPHLQVGTILILTYNVLGK
jgi:hypothetical protein